MTTAADKPLSNTQRAVQLMRDMIFNGDLAAGSDHLESELAERLNMSRTPVREAALTLESQGLLELRPRKGIRVLPISPEDMEEIYDILTELECLAARKASQKNYSQDDLIGLAKTIEGMEAAVVAEDRETWAKLDDQFHYELVRLGGNSRVQSVFELMSDQVRRARSVTLFMRPLPLKSNEDHRQLFEAISAGNASNADEIHRSHRQNAKLMMLDLLHKFRLNKI